MKRFWISVVVALMVLSGTMITGYIENAHAATTFPSTANMATSTLATEVASDTTTLVLKTGTGTKFPASNFYVTLFRQVNGAYEIVLCSTRSTDTLTVTRGSQSTTAQAWGVGTNVQQTWTKGDVDAIHTAVNGIETGATTLSALGVSGAATIGGNLTASGSAISFPNASTSSFGTDKAVKGQLDVYGNDSSSGGTIQLFSGASQESNVDRWQISATSGLYRLFHLNTAGTATSVMQVDGYGNYNTTFPGLVSIGNDLNVNGNDLVVGGTTLDATISGGGHLTLKATGTNKSIWVQPIGTGSVQLSRYGGSGTVFGDGAGGSVGTMTSGGSLSMNGNLTVAGNSYNQGVWTTFGVDKTSPATLSLYGNSTTTGGLIDFYSGATNEAVADRWQLSASSGMFRLFHVTTGSVYTTVMSVGATQAVTFPGTLAVTGASTIGGTLGVTGSTTVGTLAASTLGVSGAASFSGGITSDTNKFTVENDTGNTEIAGTLGTTGLASLGSATVSGAFIASSTANVNGKLTVDSTLVYPTVTFAANDTSPSVGSGVYFKCGTHTANRIMTALDDAIAGQEVTLIGTNNTYTTQITKGVLFYVGATRVLGYGDVLKLYYDGTVWYEVSFLDFTV